ncbi:MAG: efflux RND transporter permease subunit, partial [Aeromonas sp.]
MIRPLIGPLINNARVQLLTVALLLTAALVALQTLPRTEDPPLTSRFASVVTYLPGASAERVEALVSEPLENRLRAQSEIKLVESSSRPGISIINLELNDEINDVEPIWSRVRDRLADLTSTLPNGASAPKLDDEKGYPFTRLVNVVWRGLGEPQLDRLARYSAELERQARQLPGTEYVERVGAPQEEIEARFDPLALSASGLSSEQLAQALSGADAKVPAGELQGRHHRIGVEIRGALDTLEQIRQIPLRTGEQGQTLRLGDLANVQRTLYQPERQLAFANGERAVVVGLRMAPDHRIDLWSDRVDSMLATLQQDLPDNIGLITSFDQQRYTDQRLDTLLLNIVQGFFIIVAVLLVTLGAKAAIIVALSLPLTVAFSFACMNLINLPIHQMSVTGLVVAFGIMVDNAIVMADRVQYQRRHGMAMSAAALEAIGHLWLPLLGSTLTTLLAFMPIILMPGPAGEFVGGIAWAVICSLLGSYLIAHTLVAGLAARWISGKPGGRWYQDGLHLPAVNARFVQSITLALTHPWRTLLLVSLLPLLGFWAATRLTEQFFPPADRDMIHIEASLSPPASLERTRALAQGIATELAHLPELIRQDWVVGDNAPNFYYNLVPRKQGRADYAQGMITLQDADAAERLIPQLQQRLDARFPAAQILVRKLEQGPPFNAPVELRLFGPDLEQLHHLGETIRSLLANTQDVVQTRATLQAGAPKLWLEVDEEAAQLAGMSLTDVASQLAGALDGRVGGTVLEGTQSIPVRVRLAEPMRSDPDALLNLPLSLTSTGQQGAANLTLRALANPTLLPSWTEISRRDGERVNVLEAYLAVGVLPQTALERVKVQLAAHPLVLPPGYRLEFGGEAA